MPAKDDNFVRTFEFAEDLIEKHKKRYETLDNFFTEYNIQVASYQFGWPHPSGYCGVIELLKNIIQGKAVLRDIFIERDKYFNDPVVYWFFNGLAAELSEP